MAVNTVYNNTININDSPKFIQEAYIPFGDVLFHLSATFPLIIWYLLVNNIYYYLFINNNNNKLLGYIEMITIIILPTLIILLPTIYSFTGPGPGSNMSEKASIAELSPDWPLCFDSKFDKTAPNGAVGTWDFKCGTIQTGNNRTNSIQLSQRFYYINFGLFMLILLLQNIFRGGVVDKWVKYDNSLKYKILAVPLLLGLIGSITAVYQEFFLYSYWFMEVFAAFLTLNIMAFVILLYLLVKSKILHV